MAQGRSTKIISMIQWIRTSRLSIKNSLSRGRCMVLLGKSEGARVLILGYGSASHLLCVGVLGLALPRSG